MISLVRVLGIALDNAIEASLETPEPSIDFAVLSDNDSVTFLVNNSTLPIPFTPSELLQKGVTSKKEHSGLGLASISEITEHLPNVLFSISCQQDFHLELTIQNIKKKNREVAV